MLSARLAGIAHEAQRLDIGGDVALERRRVLARPRPHEEGAAGLVGAEEVDGPPEALHAERFGLHREGQVENGGGIVLALDHRLEAVDAGADRFDRVVGAVLEPMHGQDFLRLQRIGGVGRIDHEGATAHVGERFHVRLDEELVHAAVAAGDDHHVVLGHLDHGERVVDRRMHHIELAGGEAIALVAGIVREMELDLEAALFEDALGDAGMQRKGLGLREGIDPQDRRLVGAAGARGEREATGEHDAPRSNAGPDKTRHELLPARSRKRRRVVAG